MATKLPFYERTPGEQLRTRCGPGTITVDLACLVPQGHVTGIEPSAEQEEVLDKARHLASSQGVTNLTFSRGDGHNLPFPDNMFDVVHAHQVLQHVADPVKVLSEMKRVVKSAGGIIAVRDIDYASMVWHPPSKGLSDWHEMYERTARANGGEPNAGRVLLSWALKAGIPRDCIEPMVGTWCFSKSEEKEWWSGTWAERVVQSALAKSAVEHGISTEAELQEMATAWKSWCVAPDAWFAMLHGELICRL